MSDIIEKETAVPTVKSDENVEKNTVIDNSTQQETTGTPTESTEDPNWRAFREARKKDRAEREAAERKAADKEAEVAALKAAMEAAFGKSNSPTQQYAQKQSYQSYENEETEDQRIEKKVQAALALREAQYEQERAQREQQEYPERLSRTYTDFNATISDTNLDYLDYHYPEVAGPLKRLPDNFDKWSDIYRAVKKFVPNLDSARKDAAKVDSNFAKPKSMSTNNLTQTGEVTSSHQLTEAKRAANWERMQKTLRGLSN